MHPQPLQVAARGNLAIVCPPPHPCNALRHIYPLARKAHLPGARLPHGNRSVPPTGGSFSVLFLELQVQPEWLRVDAGRAILDKNCASNELIEGMAPVLSFIVINLTIPPSAAILSAGTNQSLSLTRVERTEYKGGDRQRSEAEWKFGMEMRS